MNQTTAPSSRRHFLATSAMSLAPVALAWLSKQDELAAEPKKPDLDRTGFDLKPKPPHHDPQAKAMISMFMHGGPSHVDLFDPKPDLVRLAGQPLPECFGPVMTRRKVAANPLLGPVKPFRARGQSGLEISDFLPYMSRCADDLCVVRGMHGDSVNHPQSVYQMNTGSVLMGHASLGSWVAYGLGSENQNMPAFVVMPDPGAGLKGGPLAWGNGYLPSAFQGTPMRPGRHPILNRHTQPEISVAQQRSTLDLVRRMNTAHLRERDFDDEMSARINAYELAFRMQTSVPELMDLSDESPQTLAQYGTQGADGSYAANCLLARRLAERGVRFIQLYHRGWDHHGGIKNGIRTTSKHVDRASAALVKDLKQRGLLDDTLVVFAGEFGRTAFAQGNPNRNNYGRDHHPRCFTTWMAGGGVRGGLRYGITDEHGIAAVDNKVHLHDLHATMLHLLGLDHERLTYRYSGRDFRLTNVSGRIVQDIIA